MKTSTWVVYAGMTRQEVNADSAYTAAQWVAKREGRVIPNHFDTWHVYPLESEVRLSVVGELTVDIIEQ